MRALHLSRLQLNALAYRSIFSYRFGTSASCNLPTVLSTVVGSTADHTGRVVYLVISNNESLFESYGLSVR